MDGTRGRGTEREVDPLERRGYDGKKWLKL